MKSFQDFYIELIEDERFYENASRNHKKETVEETARKLVNYSEGEMIYDFNANGERLHEIF